MNYVHVLPTTRKLIGDVYIAGNGVKDFVADRDDEYFIAFGNLNRGDMEVCVF